MIPKIPVGKIMSEMLLTVDAEESAQRAAERMAEHGIGSMLVTREGEIYGIVSETDLIRKVLGRGMDTNAVKLESIASYPLITIDEKEPLERAYKIMGENQIRHLVVTRKGKPCGIISSRSFMESLYP